MSDYLCITVRFLQPYSHGRGDGGEPEWPPSPLRLFQALQRRASVFCILCSDHGTWATSPPARVDRAR